jgi:hypothetical protein
MLSLHDMFADDPRLAFVKTISAAQAHVVPVAGNPFGKDDEALAKFEAYRSSVERQEVG